VADPLLRVNRAIGRNVTTGASRREVVVTLWRRKRNRHQYIICLDAMMQSMRTTVTLDSDTEALIRKRMRERGVSFKQAVNDAIRESAGSAPRRTTFRTQPAPMGLPSVNLDRALTVAGELEDEELVRKLRVRK
jgi:hypothetical protein